MADPFHQTTVAGDHPSPVIDQIRAEPLRQASLGHGHAHGRRQALAQGTGCRFNAGRMAIFWMARRQRAQLPKGLDLVQRHALRAAKMQKPIEQHGAVARRQNKAIAIGPIGVLDVELEEAAPQHGGNISEPHRRARMPGIGLGHGVHRQRADRIRHAEREGAYGVGHRVSRCVRSIGLLKARWQGAPRLCRINPAWACQCRDTRIRAAPYRRQCKYCAGRSPGCRASAP